MNFVDALREVYPARVRRAEDATALEVVGKVMAGRQVVPLPCNELAACGGVLKCVRWTTTGALALTADVIKKLRGHQ